MDDSAVQPIISSQNDVPPVAPNATEAVSEAANDSAQAAAETAATPNATYDEISPPKAEAKAEAKSAEDSKPPRSNEPMIVFAYDCLRREFDALLAHQPAAGTAPAPEDVHQMRIATRKLRVSLRLFQRMLPKAAEDLRDEIGHFARALGDVRDLDVYCDNFGSYADAVPPENADELAGYEQHLQSERAAARSKLTAVFGGKRHDELLSSFGEFVEDAPTPGAVRRWRSFKISDGVDKYLKKSLKRLLKLGNKIGDDAHAKDLHRLRIRAKRFRYELEFFVPIYPSLAKTAKATKVLQELLGIHQDACTATERLEAYGHTLRKRGSGKLPPGLATLVASQREQASDVRAKFGPEWRAFEETVTRGKLAP